MLSLSTLATGRSSASALAFLVSATVIGGVATLLVPDVPMLARNQPIRLFDVAQADATAEPAPARHSPPDRTPPPAPEPASEAVPRPLAAMVPAPAPVSYPVSPITVALVEPGAAPPASSGAAGSGAPAAAAAMPQQGSPAPHAADGPVDAYGLAVFRAVLAVQAYADEVRRLGLAGTAVIELVISPRGRIAEIALCHSSGEAQIDRLALSQARQAGPLPPPPDRRARRFRIPMTYRPR